MHECSRVYREVHHKEKLGGRGRGGEVKKMGERIKKRKRKVVRRVEEDRNETSQRKDAAVYKESSGIEEGGRSWMNSRI